MMASQEQIGLSSRVDDWLFAILRFAVTLHESDRTAALILGRILDTSGVPGSSRFSFFERTSTQVCAALSDRHAPERDKVLRRHIDRIDNPRLARAFASASGLDGDAARSVRRSRQSRAYLWRGLDEQTGRPTSRSS